MKKDKNKQPNTTALRKLAEERLKKKKSSSEPSTLKDAQRLLRELQVHQIELEIQNEELRQVSNKVEAGLAKYTALYDFSPVGYFTLARNATILQTNLTGALLLGVERSRLLRRRFSSFIARESHPAFDAFIDQVFAGRGKEIFDTALRREDNQPLYVRIQAIADESAQQCNATMLDITDRKQAEDALRKSEANYRQLFDNSPAGIYQIDFRTGKFLKANDLICEYLGLSQKEITSLSPYDLLTNESKQLFLERLQKMGLGEKVTENPEYEISDKNGKHRWLHLNSKNIYNAEGLLIGADVVAHDITERKSAGEELKKSEKKFAGLFSSMLEGVALHKIVYDSSGAPVDYIVLDINPAYESIIGLKRESIIGKKASELYGTKEAPYLELYSQVASSGKGDSLDVYFPPLNKHFAISVFSPAEGQFATIFQDITERKRAEEEKQALEERLNRAEKMEALGLLAGGVAHDLNNVIGVIVGYAELIADDIEESSPLMKGLLNIMEGGQRAAAIVQDLLTLARRGVAGRKVLNVNSLIFDFNKSPEWDKLQTYHPSVQLATDLEPDLLNISASPVHLQKSLFNLISNAAEAMPQGGKITITTTNQYLDKPVRGYANIQEGDYVVLSVSDTGEGIQEQDLQRIFEPFYTKKIMGRSGTGLGLAVVWGTLKDHQGYIDVLSEEGKGTIFTLYFPVTRDDVTVEAASISLTEYMGKGESILVVDDVKGQRDLAAAMLTKLNYKVASLASGEEALEYLKKHKVDLLVLDMIMDPGQDGLDTYKQVLEIHPGQRAIIVSGFSESDRVHDAQALGAGEYVKKPYVIEKLGMAVKKELDRK